MKNLLLLEFIQPLLIEGIMDLETTKASRSVVNLLKDYMQQVQANKKHPVAYKPEQSFLYGSFKVRSEKTGAMIPVFLYLEIRDIDILTVDSGLADGAGIKIYVSIPEDIDLLQPSLIGKASFLIDLKSIFQHEFEHYRQLQRSGVLTKGGRISKNYPASAPSSYKQAYQVAAGMTPSKGSSLENIYSDYSAAIEYYLDPAEVEAHVVQLYRTAKFKKQPFEKVLNNYLYLVLKPSFISNGMDKELVKELTNSIKMVWLDYASKRLPKQNLVSPFSI